MTALFWRKSLPEIFARNCLFSIVLNYFRKHDGAITVQCTECKIFILHIRYRAVRISEHYIQNHWIAHRNLQVLFLQITPPAFSFRKVLANFTLPRLITNILFMAEWIPGIAFQYLHCVTDGSQSYSKTNISEHVSHNQCQMYAIFDRICRRLFCLKHRQIIVWNLLSKFCF